MRLLRKTTATIKDMGGKRVARWVESREGGSWVVDAEPGSEWDFINGAVVIALPPKRRED